MDHFPSVSICSAIAIEFTVEDVKEKIELEWTEIT
jgi:hypothetical protein